MLELTTANEASALVKGVALWTWTDGFFYFSAETGVTPNTFNAGIKGGDTLTSSPSPTGTTANLALSLVYGARTTRSVSAWAAALETTLASPSTR